ncbi:MAG: NifB/NifX family molybdenum-iron cluster-binding protein [Chloroflexota bacterium]|nr:NifB/NifX family molybdenum-iron cluster-binding protein [Chloroflexota bacterium]
MRYAVPVSNGRLSSHFGHCEHFAIVDVDEVDKTITNKELVTPPPHEPGVYPGWLAEQGVAVVIAGGIGSRAQGLFKQNNIRVVVGAAEVDPEEAVLDYIQGHLSVGENVCDH